MQKMIPKHIILLFLLLLKYCCVISTNRFPDYFKFGVATSAYQIEGGWNESGKGENIWDRFVHEHPEAVSDRETGDIACDSYHLWATDIANLKELGVQYYRFSISWSRILPSGFSNRINREGVTYYNSLINGLIENKIEPIVTLYHFDLPQKIQDLGGWTSLDTATYFADYARIVFHLFGDRVKTWITINEPSSICEDPYGNRNGAPPIFSPGIGDYLCGRTILVAHAKAYHIYDKEFRKEQEGKIGITIDSIWAEPRTNETKDIEAADRELQMSLGWWAHPIFSAEGDYPEIMKSRIADRSAEENFATSRLPDFTPGEIDSLRGSADFLGLNHYHTWLISNHEYPVDDPSYQKDKGTAGFQDPKWKPDVNVVPWGFYKLIKYVAKEYNNPLVHITENGYPDDGHLEDENRVIFHREFLQALLRAVNEGCNVKSYMIWSLMDNFEWTYGYTVKFGLYQVDFVNSSLKRTPKESARFFKNVIKNREIPEQEVELNQV